MRPVQRAEIMRLGDYEAVRDAFRSRVIEEKKVRRIAVGAHVTAVFENRDTVLLQIQEMLRTERITREAAILHEIETYNQLIPEENELSATLMIEYDEREERERMLIALKGIEEHVSIRIGPLTAKATWDPARILDDRASAVLYLRFPLGADGRKALEAGDAAAIVVSHPAYAAEAPLPRALVASLVEDFAD